MEESVERNGTRRKRKREDLPENLSEHIPVIKPWVFITISMHGTKMDGDYKMYPRNYIYRACPDNVMNLTWFNGDGFKSYISSDDTVESIMRKRYDDKFIENNWGSPRPESESPEIYSKYPKNFWAKEKPKGSVVLQLLKSLTSNSIPEFYEKGSSLGSRDRIKPRELDRYVDKTLTINDYNNETYGAGFGIRFIRTNVIELEPVFQAVINRMNEHIFTNKGHIFLSQVLDEVNKIISAYSPDGTVFIADLSCNSGITHERALKAYNDGAKGKRRKIKTKNKTNKKQPKNKTNK